jgi:hypothetical protein
MPYTKPPHKPTSTTKFTLCFIMGARSGALNAKAITFYRPSPNRPSHALTHAFGETVRHGMAATGLLPQQICHLAQRKSGPEQMSVSVLRMGPRLANPVRRDHPSLVGELPRPEWRGKVKWGQPTHQLRAHGSAWALQPLACVPAVGLSFSNDSIRSLVCRKFAQSTCRGRRTGLHVMQRKHLNIATKTKHH